MVSTSNSPPPAPKRASPKLKTVDRTTFRNKLVYLKPFQLGQPDDYLVVC